MPYLSLYRKYRPRTFAEIVGQRHVTQTLANAVRANRIAHAYLFCGPRGTGKTSTALVLARALNCANGPTPEPCGECEICRRIAAGTALDVIEIDAASNRGIDEIRQLRERVGLAPAESRMKVYIIDEVHMLTQEAYNAFLKTLEEPPPHVVFVLATTEPHRVLPTILSRCQRFDFHRLGLPDIEKTVRSVAEKESLRLDPKAVTMLAHAADGSIRDALTLLDQAIAYAEEDITPEVITEILGGIDFDLIAEFAQVFIQGDVPGALGRVDRVVAEGKDLRQLVEGLIEHFRNLLLLNVSRRAREALPLPEELLTRAVEQAGALRRDEIVRTLDLLADTDRELRFASQPRVLVELMVVRACRAAAGAREQEEEAPAPEAREPAPAESAAEEPKRAATPAEPPPSRAAAGGLDEIRERWDELVSELQRSRKTSESAFLREAVPVALEEGLLTLEFRHQFHHDQMAKGRKGEERRQVVSEAIKRVFGIEVGVACRQPQGNEGSGEQPPKPTKEDRNEKLQDVMSMFPGSELED